MKMSAIALLMTCLKLQVGPSATKLVFYTRRLPVASADKVTPLDWIDSSLAKRPFGSPMEKLAIARAWYGATRPSCTGSMGAGAANSARFYKLSFCSFFFIWDGVPSKIWMVGRSPATVIPVLRSVAMTVLRLSRTQLINLLQAPYR